MRRLTKIPATDRQRRERVMADTWDLHRWGLPSKESRDPDGTNKDL